MDCAVLIVSARPNEFESGMSACGYTREHVLLAYTMDIKHLIVIVNKMDAQDVSYSEDQFNDIKIELSTFIQKVGYKLEHVAFVPVSAQRNENLINLTDKMSWFKGWTIDREGDIITGSTLLEALDAIILPQQSINKPLRLPIQAVYKIKGIGTVVTGRVETGILKQNMIVKFTPSNIMTRVKSIEMHHTPVESKNIFCSVKHNHCGIFFRGSSWRQYWFSPREYRCETITTRFCLFRCPKPTSTRNAKFYCSIKSTETYR